VWTKKLEFAHTNPSQQGMGDFYGTGIRAKIGKMRDGMGFQQVSPEKLKKPPKSVV
jgi:hypothetical protein